MCLINIHCGTNGLILFFFPLELRCSVKCDVSRRRINLIVLTILALRPNALPL